ncbi:MAG: CoA-transferase [Betaproteobacteria bacterium]|jgi:glutaconate CoA-transferase, subunit B
MTSNLSEKATVKEIMATVLARDLVDGEWVEVGANLPVPRAGVLLAHLTRGPNMTVMIAMTKANVQSEPVIEEFELITDQRAMRWAEAYYIHNDLVENMKFRRKGVFFAGALQIDPYGNSNLIGIGSDYKKLKFRGPGAIGVCNATVMNSRFHLVLNSHDKRILVPKCDFISAFGWGSGGDDARTKIGLPGGGPKYVVTPLCVMDFEEGSKRMRLKSVHPGVSVEDVVTNTGFEIIIPQTVPQTEAPSKEELQVLRERIDVRGALRH